MSNYEFEEEECSRILAMSHDELVAEIRSQGLDPDKVLEEVDRIIGCAKVDAWRRRMKITSPTNPRA